MRPDRRHPPFGTNRPHDYSSLRGDAVRQLAVDDPLTQLPIGMGQHDVDLLVGHPRFAVPARTRVDPDDLGRSPDAARAVVERRGRAATAVRRGMAPVPDVEPQVDEDTIGVAAVLGTTFTGHADDIRGINDLLVAMKNDRGL